MQKPFAIEDDYNVEDVYNGLMKLGAQLCLETLEAIIEADGYPMSIPQKDFEDKSSMLHHAPKIFKETCMIDWKKNKKQIYDFVRGLSPTPGAWTNLISSNGNKAILKIFETRIIDDSSDSPCGTLIVDGKHLYVATHDGLLELIELQLSGKKRMKVADFLNGMKGIEGFVVE